MKVAVFCHICVNPTVSNAETPKQDSLESKASTQILLMGKTCCVTVRRRHSSGVQEFLHFMFRIPPETLQGESLEEVKAESSKEFSAGIGKPNNMYCSIHNNKPLSLYCTECRKTLCFICAKIDSKHAGQHCNIQQEIQRRKDELQCMSTELNKKSIYLDTCASLQELMKDKERVKNETRELIQQTLCLLMQEKEKQLLAELEEQHNQEVQALNEKIKDIRKMVERIESTERLVEKMHLNASDQDMNHQDVMDMLLHIKASLENIRSMQPPVVDLQMQSENFTGVITQLQTLIERVTGEKEAASAILKRASNKDCSVKSSAKRKSVQQGKAVHSPQKVVRIGDLEDQPGTSSASIGGSHAAGNSVKVTDASPWFPSFITESTDPDDLSYMDSSLEEESSDEEPQDVILVENCQREAECMIDLPVVLSPGQGTLVFFDVKIQPLQTLHLAAIGDNSNCFSVTFRQELVLDRGDMKPRLCEHGLDNFLSYLQSLHMPILVCYNLWTMNILALVTALEAVKKDQSFIASIIGFIDAFPLLKEKIRGATSYKLKSLDRIFPLLKEKIRGATSYKLKSLDRIFFHRQLNDTQAEDCAKTLKDLCTFLEINPITGRDPVIAYSSLQCYISLQPLLEKKLLYKTCAKTLALHNVDLSRLKSVFEDSPGFGLQRFSKVLNTNLRKNERKIRNLSKIRTYFQTCAFATGFAKPWKATN